VQGHLYAAYIEVTRPLEDRDGDRQRRQWLVLPPLLPQYALDGQKPQLHISYFSRSQEHVKNRVAWRFFVDTEDIFPRDLAERVDRFVRLGYAASPLITCEVHHKELAELIASPKTPYRLLDRVQRVAKAKYGLAIS
jgi:hypothetical protein